MFCSQMHCVESNQMCLSVTLLFWLSVSTSVSVSAWADFSICVSSCLFAYVFDSYSLSSPLNACFVLVLLKTATVDRNAIISIKECVYPALGCDDRIIILWHLKISSLILLGWENMGFWYIRHKNTRINNC